MCSLQNYGIISQTRSVNKLRCPLKYVLDVLEPKREMFHSLDQVEVGSHVPFEFLVPMVCTVSQTVNALNKL